jgi:hypothetical protein
MMSDRSAAMSAPGSPPVTPLPPAEDQGEPSVQLGASIRTGTDGKPAARAGSCNPPRPAWGTTTTPDTVREN